MEILYTFAVSSLTCTRKCGDSSSCRGYSVEVALIRYPLPPTLRWCHRLASVACGSPVGVTLGTSLALLRQRCAYSHTGLCQRRGKGRARAVDSIVRVNVPSALLPRMARERRQHTRISQYYRVITGLWVPLFFICQALDLVVRVYVRNNTGKGEE